MQRLTIIIWIFLLPTYVSGQLYTMSDHYVYHALAINPAYSGIHDALSTTVLYRDQFTGFEGSPTTMSLSIHTPLDNERVGLGFLVMNDHIGVCRETSFVGNYAYRMDLGDGKLAFGLGAGITFCCTDWNKLAARDVDDELLINNSSTGIMPDFSVGIYYTARKYFVGLSVPLFLSHEYDSRTNKYIIKNNIKEYNYFCNTGYIFDINPDIGFFPSLLFKYHKGNPSQIDISSQIILKNRIWLGLSYRSHNILVGMIQCQVNKQLRIAYSYDIGVGKPGYYKNNSQEFMINYIFKYSAEVTGPRQF